MIQDTHTTD